MSASNQYRNKHNGLVGEMTAEQAAIFPNLELVVDVEEVAPTPTDTPTPAKASK